MSEHADHFAALVVMPPEAASTPGAPDRALSPAGIGVVLVPQNIIAFVVEAALKPWEPFLFDDPTRHAGKQRSHNKATDYAAMPETCLTQKGGATRLREHTLVAGRESVRTTPRVAFPRS